jgi:hypothetical protein
MWVGWSDEGLWIAARVKAAEPKPGNPREFWEAPCLELFVDPSGEAQDGWSGSAHQFWFSPVKEGNAWRLYAGEWKRSGAIADTIYDDKRCRTAMRVGAGEYVIETLIPAAALGGRPPKAGQSWRLALSLRHQDAAGSSQGAWPRAKDEGILEGTAAWGTIKLLE